ncbi:MAG: S41 family peptidase, partial [Bacteroidota bacterium]
FYRMISKVGAMVREGHTYVQRAPADKNEKYKILPFRVHVSVNRLLIQQSDIPANQWMEGAEILSINQRNTSNILQKISGSTGLKSGFNNSALFNVLSQYNNFALAYYYFVDTSQDFVVEYILPHQNQPQTIIVSGQLNSFFRQPFPIFRIEADPPVTLSIDNRSGIATLKVSTFAYWTVSFNKKKYFAFFNDCFAKLKHENIHTLVIDVRNNRGGDETIAAELLTYLIPWEFKLYEHIKVNSLDFKVYNQLSKNNLRLSAKDYIRTDSGFFKINDDLLRIFIPQRTNRFTGKVYFLANGGTCSAASTFLSLAQYHHVGKIVGQESGGIAKEVDGHQRIELRLPYSGIKISFPLWSLRIKTANPEFARGVIPDYVITPTSADLLSRRDVEMEFIYHLKKESETHESDEGSESKGGTQK